MKKKKKENKRSEKILGKTKSCNLMLIICKRDSDLLLRLCAIHVCVFLVSFVGFGNRKIE